MKKISYFLSSLFLVVFLFAFNSNVFSDPTITVTAPASGANWINGTTQSITWTQSDVFDVDLELQTDLGVHVGDIDAGISASPYSWVIPGAGIVPPGSYKIHIYKSGDHSIEGVSDAFNILAPTITVIAPDASTKWVMGSTHDISWSVTGGPYHVDIELWKIGGGASIWSTSVSTIFCILNCPPSSL